MWHALQAVCIMRETLGVTVCAMAMSNLRLNKRMSVLKPIRKNHYLRRDIWFTLNFYADCIKQ